MGRSRESKPWVQFRADRSTDHRADQASASQQRRPRARLRELERENKVLRQEREGLKQAAAFFARETDRP